jgi:hypothetical protein
MRAAALLVQGHPELGGDHDLVTPVAQRPPQQLFGAALTPIDVGGVEQRDAVLECGVDDLLGGIGVQAPAEVVAPQPHDGHRERPDRA